MRSFKHFNQASTDICPVCGTNDDKETVLIGIDGTEEGNIQQAAQFHLDCINLNYDISHNLIYGRTLL